MEIHGQGNASRLRERRLQRGMTQQEVAEALERLAWLQQSQRVGVNPDMVSKWERGTKRPSRLYLRLLCALFEVTPAQLGYGRSEPEVAPALPPTGSVTSELAAVAAVLDGAFGPMELLQPKMLDLWRDDLLSRRQVLRMMGVAPAAGGLEALETTLRVLPAPHQPQFRGQETVAQLDGLVHELERLYHSTDPRRLLLPVRGLVGTVEDFLPDARKEVRRALLGILTRANLLAGRLSFFDLHESFQARAHLDLAREAAGEAGSPLLSAVVLGHLAFLPAEKHNFPATASYLAGARDSLTRQPASLVAAWISAIESEMTTKNAATSQALACLERAKAELAMASSMPVPEWFDFFDESRLRGFEGFALRRAGDVDGARARLQAALVPAHQTTPKQRSVTMIDLAVTCVMGGDIDEGCRLATQAASDLREAGYATAVERLTEFQGVLPDQRHPAARLLRESIAELS